MKSKEHRRRIRISLVLPATVELIVGTYDDNPDEHSDWSILSVVSTSCFDATPRLVGEQMHDVDFEALGAAAANAKDLS